MQDETDKEKNFETQNKFKRFTFLILVPLIIIMFTLGYFYSLGRILTNDNELFKVCKNNNDLRVFEICKILIAPNYWELLDNNVYLLNISFKLLAGKNLTF